MYIYIYITGAATISLGSENRGVFSAASRSKAQVAQTTLGRLLLYSPGSQDVYTCIYMYVYRYIYIYIYIYTYICVYSYIYVYVCVYIHIYVYIYINIYTYTYIYTYVYLYIHLIHLCITNSPECPLRAPVFVPRNQHITNRTPSNCRDSTHHADVGVWVGV